MNELNYGTKEACQRLYDAGIVVETEAVWRFDKDKDVYFLTNCNPMSITTDIPALSMAEAWRELPDWIDDYGTLEITKFNDALTCGYHKGLAVRKPVFKNHNPTNALIYLLIWVTKEKP
jgi:hypothetical protein